MQQAAAASREASGGGGDRNACLQRAAQRLWRLNASRVATHRLSATRYFGAQCSTMKLNYGMLPPALLRTGGCSPQTMLLLSARHQRQRAVRDRGRGVVAWSKTSPLLVHANWAVGENQKRAKLLAAGLWGCWDKYLRTCEPHVLS